ncbi:response regulator [Puia sp.]|jgi:CheY-like chemotaxis protein|uniref:response regulator n=1 Tax=Puia sp. TaxID=2045100 RepID=UPI002F3E6244
MNGKSSLPIVIIEDDSDDQDMFRELIVELGIPNPLIFFDNATDAFDFLLSDGQPFLILCDVNLPMQTGLEFKRTVDEHPELRKKSIPFVFCTTSIDPGAIKKAYLDMTVQGYFKKGASMEEMRRSLKVIFEYWLLSVHPNSI